MTKPRQRCAGEASRGDHGGTAIDPKFTRRLKKSQRSCSLDKASPASVYRGLDRIGDLEPAGDRWSAVTPDGVVLGVFASKREAARAVLEVAP